jgi:protein phosphatase
MMEYRAGQDGETLTIVTEEGLTVRAVARTDMGMIRSNNEDNVQVWTFDQFLIGMVADGMGGAAGGEFASRLAVDAVQEALVGAYPDAEAWHSASEDDLTYKMVQSLIRANQDVLDRAAEDQHLQGMGTTTTMVILRGKRALFAHIGDSRAYLVDGITRRVGQVSKDHSFVEALVMSGHLTPEQAAVHPMKNVLYRALGQKPESELEVDVYTRDFKSGDCLILCSDGLTRHVSDFEIGDLAMKYPDPAEATQRLINLAKERGGEDNISVLAMTIA